MTVFLDTPYCLVFTVYCFQNVFILCARVGGSDDIFQDDMPGFSFDGAGHFVPCLAGPVSTEYANAALRVRYCPGG
jgi:hypothetical protein